MSGHSKFANIKHKKEKNDAAKGKIFTIIGREIAVAVKEGGPDPANNFKLAQVIAKGQGNVGTPGCVSFMFDKKGLIIIDKEDCDMDADDLMMTALDAGAEDFSEEEDSYEVYTDPDQWSEVDAALKEAGITPISSEVTMIPQNWVALTDETAIKNLQKTLDLLEDDDDVQAVYHNWDE